MEKQRPFAHYKRLAGATPECDPETERRILRQQLRELVERQMLAMTSDELREAINEGIDL